MSSEVTTKTSVRCQLGNNCNTNACLAVLGRDNLPACLMHFVGQLDAPDALVDSGVSILDEHYFHDQASNVKDLWQLAVGDLVMQMYQRQWQEEKSLAADPLSILTFNAPHQKKKLAQTMGGAVVHTQANTQVRERKSQIGHVVDFAAQKNKSDLYVQNPYARREPDRSNSLFSKRSSTESHAAALIRIEQDDAAEEEAAIKAYNEGNRGDVCTRCNSPWVVVRNSSAFDGTRSEIWGTKDAQSSFFIECRKCKYVELQIEGR
jgi:hypothetical protein